MSEMKKAAGYIRVSTPGQVDDESLSTQRKSIRAVLCKKNHYELTKIYADEGIKVVGLSRIVSASFNA